MLVLPPSCDVQMTDEMIVLGIETSCDETGIALYDSKAGLLSHALYSQVATHADYGGVVPELASRDHINKTLPLIDQVLGDANLEKSDISAIAYTSGPGLVGALMAGAAIAQSLAMALNVPIVGVHHMEGHLLAPMLEDQPPEFPFVGLLVSGGHTQLVSVKGFGDYELMGESLDDAAGEAFDKAAKMLDLDYPGGPHIAAMAAKAREQGVEEPVRFPRPMTDRPGLDFSFSGLKTYTLNTIATFRQQDKLDETARASIALAFENAVVDTLRIKCKRALEQSGFSTLVIAGGVSANSQLRHSLEQMVAKMNARVFYARPEFCTDNGAMIAFAGCKRLQAGERSDQTIQVRPRWPLNELSPFSESAV